LHQVLPEQQGGQIVNTSSRKGASHGV
jgi:hypothetical protein